MEPTPQQIETVAEILFDFDFVCHPHRIPHNIMLFGQPDVTWEWATKNCVPEATQQYRNRATLVIQAILVELDLCQTKPFT